MVKKLCIIGTGQEAKASHLPNFRKNAEFVEIAAVCDVNIEAARLAAEQFQVPRFYASHAEMLDTEKPDMVSVCVPNRFHAEIVLDALAHGCDVFCEKPPAIAAADAERMEAAAYEADRLLTYNFHYRQAPEVQAVKRLIKQGAFGAVYAAKAVALRRRGVPGWGNFTNKALQGGGPLMDIGVHMLDAALYLLGYPKAEYVCANQSDLIGKKGGVGTYGAYDGARFEVEDALFGYIQFRNGLSIQVETSFTLNRKEDQTMNVELYGENMGASVFGGELYRTAPDGMMMDEKLRPAVAVDRRLLNISHFIQCCITREQPLCKPSEGTALMRLVEALYRSAEERRPITL